MVSFAAAGILRGGVKVAFVQYACKLSLRRPGLASPHRIVTTSPRILRVTKIYISPRDATPTFWCRKLCGPQEARIQAIAGAPVVPDARRLLSLISLSIKALFLMEVITVVRGCPDP